MADYELIDNSEEVLSALERAKERALEAIGMTAERHAKEILSETVYGSQNNEESGRTWKLTGRLRNSITYAISGKGAKLKEYSDRT